MCPCPCPLEGDHQPTSVFHPILVIADFSPTCHLSVHPFCRPLGPSHHTLLRLALNNRGASPVLWLLALVSYSVYCCIRRAAIILALLHAAVAATHQRSPKQVLELLHFPKLRSGGTTSTTSLSTLLLCSPFFPYPTFPLASCLQFMSKPCSKLAKDCTTSRLVCFIYIWRNHFTKSVSIRVG